MIYVNRPFIPNRKSLERYLGGVCERGWLTNNGPLVRELTEKLEEYLGVENLLLVANGTLALQIAYRTLGLTGSAVTTPFTFPATAGALEWMGVEPLYSTVNPETMNLDPHTAIERARQDTTALVPVHTYGNPCDVEVFAELADKHQLRLVYDASHCFGVTYRGRSILSWGDAATISFHATKLFSTVEGGAVVFRYREDLERARRLINFGLQSDGTTEELGINGKMSEFHAAYGLAALPDMDEVISERLSQMNDYWELLGDVVRFPTLRSGSGWNGAYCCIISESEEQVLQIQKALYENNIQSRRYFRPLDPSFDRPPLNCVLCLPLLVKRDRGRIERIAAVVRSAVEE